jgi:hypothetical protein
MPRPIRNPLATASRPWQKGRSSSGQSFKGWRGARRPMFNQGRAIVECVTEIRYYSSNQGHGWQFLDQKAGKMNDVSKVQISRS